MDPIAIRSAEKNQNGVQRPERKELAGHVASIEVLEEVLHFFGPKRDMLHPETLPL
jgi:hypothetical protein